MIDRLIRTTFLGAAILCGGVPLGGCQVQSTTVVDQTAAAGAAPGRVAVRVVARSPCAAPARTGPFERLPRPQSGSAVPMPPRALAEHVDGCAGVRFRIGPDGSPRDIMVLAEYPLGYGFGDTAHTLVGVTRWPPKDDTAWHYLVVNMRPHGTPPS